MKFDAYEFVAVIIPGALPTLTASLLIPEVAEVLKTEGVELGAFGIFLIVSFVVGQVVHVVGNVIESFEEMLGVGRSSMPFCRRRRPVTPEQWGRFERLYRESFRGERTSISRETWTPVAKEVYARLRTEGRTDRIDVFIRTYGLCRGMVAGAISTSALIVCLGGPDTWQLALMVFGFISIPLYIRMRHFSALYVGELVTQFLALERCNLVG